MTAHAAVTNFKVFCKLLFDANDRKKEPNECKLKSVTVK